MLLLELFYEFFKIGLFSIGGGLATLPFLYELEERCDWFTKADIANMLAISESTPGPLGVNMSTYVGFSNSGVIGGVVATLGLICPSIIIIIIIANFLKKFQGNRYVESAFYGLRPASAGLIAAAGIEVARVALLNSGFTYQGFASLAGLFNWKAVILAVVLFLATNYKKLKKVHPVVFIAASAVIGVVFRFAGAA